MSEPTDLPAEPPRFTLRQLPVPAKLVLTLFMLTVGLGYLSALVQMHFQHTPGDGQPMPTVDDVVEIFAGKKKWVKTEQATRPGSKLEALIMGAIEGAPWNGSGSMAPAFFKKDGGEYNKLTKNPDAKTKIDAEREGERRALQMWIKTPEAERKAAYDADRFIPPADQTPPAALTPKFAVNPSKIGDGIKVKSILADRCVRCHAKNADQAKYPLEVYAELARYMEDPAAGPAPVEGGWVASDRQMGTEKLAQSTHAHLLSFAMLFALTGLVFAFSSYPAAVRCLLAPLALLAQVADVSCWWLARLPDVGPYFAMAIVGTGGLVGLGLAGQIVLSVFNMYGRVGKVVLLLLFVGAGAGGSVVYSEVVVPHLKQQKDSKAKQEAAKKAEDAALTKPVAQPEEKKDAPAGPTRKGKTDPPPPAAGPSKLEKLLTGPFDTKGPWGGKNDGGMVPAFFHKDDEFKEALKEAKGNADALELKPLRAEREGEQAALLAWIPSTPAERKAAYETDRFTLPAALAGKPITPAFKADDTAVKVKSLIDTRCVRCHKPGEDQEEYPLTSYEAIEKYLKPSGVAVVTPEEPARPTPQAPTPTAPMPTANPIPAAKE